MSPAILIRPGDTTMSLARRAGITPALLVFANRPKKARLTRFGLEFDELTPGHLLRLPTPARDLSKGLLPR